MKRALMYAHVAYMIQQFNMENIRLLLEMGYQVDVACNMEQGSPMADEKVEQFKHELEQGGVRLFHVPVPRKISKVGDICLSINQTRKLINENEYELIHCHSPIGGMICRVAYRLSKQYKKAKLLYTAHGFHFYKDAPRKNWMLYYPVEKLCSCWTEVLITINQEDYVLAQAKMKAKKVEWIHGIGIDLKRFEHPGKSRTTIRAELGIPQDAIVLMSVGELNQNKNHSVVIEALGQLQRKDIYYIICGQGSRGEEFRQKATGFDLAEQIRLLGYRDDIPLLYHAADICVFPSIREGLGMGAVEGMACGLPLIVADNRGTRCYTKHGENGLVCRYDCVEEFAEAILKLADDCELRCHMGAQSKECVKEFSSEEVNRHMSRIYGKNN